ncbi:MAG: tyrosine-type recombinase/integrase [Saprospiraceae bacterium]|nr:tyrosine-type recombinase/integrase [Saprospiraceae bacterium]
MASKSNKINFSYIQNKRPGWTKETVTTILGEIHFTVNGKRRKCRFSTGLKCAIGKFEKMKRVPYQVANATKINQRLDEIRANAEPAYLQAIASGTFPTDKKFVDMILNGVFEVKQERDMMNDLDLYMEYLQNKKVHRGTLSNVASLKRHLLELKRRTKYVLNYDSINMEFYGKFQKHLRDSPEQYSENSIGNLIKKLKMFLNWAKANGWNPHDFYKHRDFKIPEIRVQNIYLEEYEVQALFNLDLTNRPELSKTRDWFILATQTALRYSDYDQFRKSNIVEVSRGYNFVYTPRKTRTQNKGASVTVPLTDLALQIAERYGFNMPKPVSNQKMNLGLMKLATLAGINKQISSHDARRTFATLAYKSGTMDIYSIMMITGHKTQKEFFKYLCIEGEETAEMIRVQNPRFQVDRPGLLGSK